MTSNLFDLTGRVAVVTGAASGLGQAMAIGLAQHGANIAAADINDVGLAQTVERVTSQGRQALAIHCDISQPDDVNRLFEIVDQVLGGVDILVNDPFTLARYKPEDLTLEDWNRVMSVNITGYFLCAQAAGRREGPTAAADGRHADRRVRRHPRTRRRAHCAHHGTGRTTRRGDVSRRA